MALAAAVAAAGRGVAAAVAAAVAAVLAGLRVGVLLLKLPFFESKIRRSMPVVSRRSCPREWG